MTKLTLPREINIRGARYKINSDFRTAISILQLYEDPDLTDRDKQYVALGLLFAVKIPVPLQPAAAQGMMWFLSGGDIRSPAKSDGGRQFSWVQDLTFILSAADKVLGQPSREQKHLHWWTFLSAFNEIDSNCVFAQILNQRRLKVKGKQSAEDKEWWSENEHIAKLTNRESAEDKKVKERFVELMNGE